MSLYTNGRIQVPAAVTAAERTYNKSDCVRHQAVAPNACANDVLPCEAIVSDVLHCHVGAEDLYPAVGVKIHGRQPRSELQR